LFALTYLIYSTSKIFIKVVMSAIIKFFQIVFLAVVTLFLVSGLVILASKFVMDSNVPTAKSGEEDVLLANRLARIGNVVTGEARPEEVVRAALNPSAGAAAVAPAAGAEPRSGKEVYAAVCAACHDSGAAGSPVKGNKDQWQPRANQGLATLIDHAINGIRGMPARGGNPGVTDAEIENTIVYMLSESGITLASEKEAVTDPTQKLLAIQVQITEKQAALIALLEAGDSDGAAEKRQALQKEIQALQKERETLQESLKKDESAA
jgi:cytochrome c5